jgi:hypothetical protein
MDRPIRAFTLTFDNALYDEASIAEAQALHVGATYHPIPITGREIADSMAIRTYPFRPWKSILFWANVDRYAS